MANSRDFASNAANVALGTTALVSATALGAIAVDGVKTLVTNSKTVNQITALEAGFNKHRDDPQLVGAANLISHVASRQRTAQNIVAASTAVAAAGAGLCLFGAYKAATAVAETVATTPKSSTNKR